MLDALISAGSKLLGGFLSDKATEKNNAANLAFQREQLDRNEALQREFANSGIQWKVQDAEKAGVHPLYALGANTTSFSPISMSASSDPKTGLGNALSDMGQDVSRAIRATSSAEDRAYNDTMKRLNLRKASLENDLLASQIAKNSGAQIGPALPTGPSAAGPIPEDKEHKERPQLLVGGKKWLTDPNTSNQESFEDRYGDIADVAGAYIFYKDREYAYPSVQKAAADAYRSWYSNIHGKVRGFLNRRRGPEYNWNNWINSGRR